VPFISEKNFNIASEHNHNNLNGDNNKKHVLNNMITFYRCSLLKRHRVATTKLLRLEIRKRGTQCKCGHVE